MCWLMIRWDIVSFTWRQFHRKCSRYLSLIWVWKSIIQDYSHISQGPMSWYQNFLWTSQIANLGPTWGPPGSWQPHVGPRSFAIRDVLKLNEVALNKTNLTKEFVQANFGVHKSYKYCPAVPSANLPLTSQLLTDGGTVTDGTDRQTSSYIQLQQNNNETSLTLHTNKWWNPRPELCVWHEWHVNVLTSWIYVG